MKLRITPKVPIGLSLITLVALLWAIPLTAQNNLAGSVLSEIKIDNFGQIDLHYFRGAQPKGDDYSDLAALGIKTVINLTSDDADPDEKAAVERAGMTYFQIPMTTRKIPNRKEISEFLAIVNDDEKLPVFVHCVGGKHRTGVMSAIYRMSEHGWNADQAFQEMKKFKFGAALFHPEFKDFVYSYYSKLGIVHETSDQPAVSGSAN